MNDAKMSKVRGSAGSGKENEVDFMLQRTAALLLTDRRSNRYRHQTVGIRAAGKPDATTIPSIPLLLSTNILRLWESFKTDVVNIAVSLLARLPSGSKKIIPREIDWSKTCEAFAGGGKDPVLKEKLRLSQKEDRIMVENIIHEYFMHISLLNTFFKECWATLPGSLLQVADKLKRLESELEVIFSHIKGIGLRTTRQNVGLLRELREAFQALIQGEITSIDNLYRQYLVTSQALFKLSENNSFICEMPLKWRSRYVQLETGLGVGKDLLVAPSTAPPRLFEMWCFFEFVNLITRDKDVHIAQKCFIAPQQDLRLFEMENSGHFFYNFRGEKAKGTKAKRSDRSVCHSKVLKSTCVEWFLELKDGLRIVFDTKYKVWSSIDNLQVLGYMTDFDAEMGVIIFSGDLKPHQYSQPAILSDRIVKVDIDNGKKFIALSLPPSAEYSEENRQTLKHLADIIFSRG